MLPVWHGRVKLFQILWPALSMAALSLVNRRAAHNFADAAEPGVHVDRDRAVDLHFNATAAAGSAESSRRVGRSTAAAIIRQLQRFGAPGRGTQRQRATFLPHSLGGEEGDVAAGTFGARRRSESHRGTGFRRT